MYRIIVADDQEVYRAGTVALLERSADRPVIAEHSDWTGLIESLSENDAAVIIVSVSLVRDMGELIAHARKAKGRALLIAEDWDSLNRYRSTGAAGAMHRSASASLLLDTVRRIRVDGSFILPMEGAATLQLGPQLANRFTSRELTILGLLMEGLKTRHIAEHLDLAEYAVKAQFQKIFDKTGFSNRLELALYLSVRR
jgi:DNA-binding NarL/FixJ family response regulator